MDSHAVARVAESFFKPALAGIVPYEPGKPAEEVQRELGLAKVVKLASNEGPFGPFPAASEALARGIPDLNRYPDGGFYRLRHALAERHGVLPEQVAPASGADGVVMYLSLAALDPGDEVVCGWPSFPSYVLDALKLGATCRQVPLRDDRYDLGAMLGAITRRTKIVYVCNPNNPTGTMVGRGEIDAYFERVPDHVLTVLDEAYFEYVEDPDYPDGIEEHLKRGRRVLVLRTFSKIYGLAGLRVGYGVGPAEVVTAIRKVQNAFDVTQPAQDAALASLGDDAEIARRRRAQRRRPRDAGQRPRRARVARRRAAGRQLRLRRGRRRQPPALRGAAARRRDRAAAARLRGPHGDPCQRGHAGGVRRLPRGAPPCSLRPS